MDTRRHCGVENSDRPDLSPVCEAVCRLDERDGTEHSQRKPVKVSKLVPALADFIFVTVQFAAFPFMASVAFPWHKASDPVKCV